jgi:hypothetical protein
MDCADEDDQAIWPLSDDATYPLKNTGRRITTNSSVHYHWAEQLGPFTARGDAVTDHNRAAGAPGKHIEQTCPGADDRVKRLMGYKADTEVLESPPLLQNSKREAKEDEVGQNRDGDRGLHKTCVPRESAVRPNSHHASAGHQPAKTQQQNWHDRKER